MAQVVDAVMEEEESRRQVAQPVVRRGSFPESCGALKIWNRFMCLRRQSRFQTRGESYVEEPEEEDDFDDLRNATAARRRRTITGAIKNCAAAAARRCWLRC